MHDDNCLHIQINPRSTFGLLLFHLSSWFVLLATSGLLYLMLTAASSTYGDTVVIMLTAGLLLGSGIILVYTTLYLIHRNSHVQISLDAEGIVLARDGVFGRDIHWNGVASVIWHWAVIGVRNDSVAITIIRGRVSRHEFEQASTMMRDKLGQRFQLPERDVSRPDYLGLRKGGYFRVSLATFIGVAISIVGLLWQGGVEKLWFTVIGAVIALSYLWLKDLRGARTWSHMKTPVGLQDGTKGVEQ